MKTQREWDQFVARFAQVDKQSGKPKFVSGSGFFGDPERVDFKLDFESEAVLILAAGKTHKEGLGGFMDVEVFEHKDRLRAFVFFASQPGKPNLPDHEAKETAAEHLYLVKANSIHNLSIILLILAFPPTLLVESYRINMVLFGSGPVQD